MPRAMSCCRHCPRTARAVSEATHEASSSTTARLVAVVNNGSNSVALFRRDGDVLKFDKVVSTTSAPVSVDFGNDHLYVAGATTVDSFVLHQNSVQVAGRHDRSRAGGRRGASGRQHGSSRRDRREAAARHAEDGSGSRHGRHHRAGSRPSQRIGADRGLRSRWNADTLRIRRPTRRHGADHAGALESGWAVSGRLVYVRHCRRARRRRAG